jgi:hypothetical protein
MLKIFQKLQTPAQDRPLSVVTTGDYAADYPTDPTSLFPVIQKRPATLIVFVDMLHETQNTLFPALNQLYTLMTSDATLNAAATLLVILGKWGTDVTNATSQNYWYPLAGPTPPSCLAMSNDAWASSFGVTFAAGFVNQTFAPGDTPFVYMVTQNLRIVDMFHMGSTDTGDGGAVSPTDLLTFQVTKLGTPTTPVFSDLPGFLHQRMHDHITGAASAAAQFPHPALDLGDQITVTYSKKGIGTGAGAAPFTAANLSWQSGAAPKADVAPGDTQYNQGAGQILLDAYVSSGEKVTYSPKDSDLMTNRGQTLNLYLKDAGGGVSAITDTEGTPMQEPGADPFLIAGIPIGTPSLFVRANLTDEGVHAAPLYMSPDISIVHDTTLTTLDVQNYLGTDSNSYAETGINPQPAVVPVPNRLFLRAFNKGTMKVRNLQGVIYWAPPSTLVMPTAWTPIRNAGAGPYVFFNGADIAAPPSGTAHSLLVSEEFQWTANLPPFVAGGGDLNHFCLVAMVGADDDPVYAASGVALPDLQYLQGIINNDWNAYYAFVTLKNVAWKNIMTVDYSTRPAPPPPGGLPIGKRWPPFWQDVHHLKLPLVLPVPPKNVPHQLEVVNRLPTTWGVNLVADRRMAAAAKGGFEHPSWKFDKEDAVVERLRPLSNRIPDLRFFEEERNGVLLDVTLPEFVGGGTFALSVRQMFKGREIGRLTFVVKMPRFPGGKPVFPKEKK